MKSCGNGPRRDAANQTNIRLHLTSRAALSHTIKLLERETLSLLNCFDDFKKKKILQEVRHKVVFLALFRATAIYFSP